MEDEKDIIKRRIAGSYTVGDMIACKEMIKSFEQNWKIVKNINEHIEDLLETLERKYRYL